MIEPSSILVTGGAGFIGSHLVDFFLRRYSRAEIIVVDKFTYAADERNLVRAVASGRVRILRGDICDPELLPGCTNGVELAVNAAAESHVDSSFTNPALFIQTNVLGTQRFIEACMKGGVRTVIHCSTDEVYGPCTGDPVSEDTSFSPSSPYAASKAAAEAVLSPYKIAFGMDIRIIRPNNVVGIRQHTEKLIPHFVACALSGTDFPIHADGMQRRSFLTIEDFCAAIDLIVSHGDKSGIYNVGVTESSTILEVAEAVLKNVGTTRSRCVLTPGRPYNDAQYKISSEKLNKLGWRPRLNVFQALPSVIDWYRRERVPQE